MIEETLWNLYLQKKELAKLDIEEPYKTLLLKKYSLCLAKYNDNIWSKFSDLYSTFDSLYRKNNLVKNVILYILITLYNDKLLTISTSYLFSIIETFAYNKINPNNFSNYLKLFFNPEILNLITALNQKYIPCFYTMIIITQEYSLKELEFNNGQIIIDYLNKLGNKYVSPIFKNNYTFFNIYESLKVELKDLLLIKKARHILFLEMSLDDDHKWDLISQIREIETSYIPLNQKLIEIVNIINLTYCNYKTKTLKKQNE